MIVSFIADQHIKLGQKNVPRVWQYNRFMLLADEINKLDCKYHIFGGDLLDVANPSIEEIGLMYDFLTKIEKHIIMIPGNHEMKSKKKDCYGYISNMLQDLGVEVIRDFQTIDGLDYIPYNILKDKTWPTPNSNIAITHVRGEIPPHIKPEIDLEKFSQYEKVFAGDLHSNKCSQGNILYPGSPFNTSFHRTNSDGVHGIFLIGVDTGEHSWVELKLPQLLRKTVLLPEEMVATEYHYTIYEIEGDMEDLANIENTDLLDKKITKNISTPPTLALSGDLSDELGTYLHEIKGIKSVTAYVTLFKDIVLD